MRKTVESTIIQENEWFSLRVIYYQRGRWQWFVVQTVIWEMEVWSFGSTSHSPPLLVKTLSAQLPDIPDALQVSFPSTYFVDCACDPTRANIKQGEHTVHHVSLTLYCVLPSVPHEQG